MQSEAASRMRLSDHLRDRRRLGALAEAIEALAAAGIDIGDHIRSARLNNDLGALETTNVHSEVQQKLDCISDELVLSHLKQSTCVGAYASEEQEHAVELRPSDQGGEYCVLSDPLDGSSNLDVAAGVGTIFSILPMLEDATASACQPGANQVSAGYILYGSSILMVVATAAGVDMYVLDPTLQEFFLVDESLAMPEERKQYSINEAYSNDFADGVNAYLQFAHDNGYSARYIGSMVADVHRTLIKGGVFIYPATTKSPDGKLRLMYEGNPMAYVMEKAGGLAVDGSRRILDVSPREVHQRTPVILGSRKEVDLVLSHLE